VKAVTITCAGGFGYLVPDNRGGFVALDTLGEAMAMAVMEAGATTVTLDKGAQERAYLESRGQAPKRGAL
jgi:hypothetical protein